MPVTLLTVFCSIITKWGRFGNCEGLCPHLRILQFKTRSQQLVDVIWYLSFMAKMLMLQLLRKTNLGPVKQNNNSLVNKCLYDCS